MCELQKRGKWHGMSNLGLIRILEEKTEWRQAINHVVVDGELIGVNDQKGGQAHLSNSYYVPFVLLGALYSLSHF